MPHLNHESRSARAIREGRVRGVCVERKVHAQRVVAQLRGTARGVVLRSTDREGKPDVPRNEQPTLIVNDVKSGADASGGVALWLEPGTVAHFRNLTIKPR